MNLPNDCCRESITPHMVDSQYAILAIASTHTTHMRRVSYIGPMTCARLTVCHAQSCRLSRLCCFCVYKISHSDVELTNQWLRFNFVVVFRVSVCLLFFHRVYNIVCNSRALSSNTQHKLYTRFVCARVWEQLAQMSDCVRLRFR